VIVILADDQSYDTLWAMPSVSALLAPQSIAFDRAYVTVPMCCPMRASLLSGGWYPRDTGVLTNTAPMGGVGAFTDTDTLGTRLQAQGVATGMFGKYLNEYPDVAPYVPAGWDTWVATADGDFGYAQNVVIGDSSGAAGVITGTGGEHITPYLFDQALAFVDQHADQPFFVYLNPQTPHVAAQPETEDSALYTDYTPRGPAWNEADVSDKAGWLQARALLSDEEIGMADANARRMLQSLTSFDRNVGRLIEGLEARGVLDDTLILYTSDNGYLNGEHRLVTKGWPYEEAIHVPLYVRYPGIAPRTDTRLVQVNTDLAATVLSAFGAASTGEGLSLLDAFADPTSVTRDHIFLDSYGSGGVTAPVWSGVVTDRYKYIEWASGESELYDLVDDPYELDALADDPTGDRSEWAAWVDEHRALAITTTSLTAASEGESYNAALESWGGQPPLRWSLTAGALPAGLTFSDQGHLQGKPEETGTFDFTVMVEDASASPWNGLSERYYQDLTLVVGAETFFAPRVRVSRTGTDASFSVRARPGVSVQVRASIEPAFDGPVRASEAVVVGPSGTVEVPLAGLDVGRPWYWIVRFDGVAGAHGELLP
jgi:arylsulfatase A-like enzyme